jgi:pimeloyl-ACP methyl ester carboxylesterase
MKIKNAVLLAAGLAASALLARSVAAGESEGAKQFKKSFVETQDSWKRRDLVRGLDPKDKDQLELLLDFVMKQQDWYMREAAIDTMATAFDPSLITTLEKEAQTSGKDHTVPEGVVMAFGRSGNKERVPFIASQITTTKKWQVKRACAIALGLLPHKDGVEALISAWEKEDDFMVWVHILESLEKVTKQKNMPKARDWRGWWNAVKDTWEPPTEDADKLDDESNKSGDRIQTKVRGTNLDIRSRGNGLPLLVLPDYGCEKDYLETYLRILEENNQILYVKLPGTADFDPPLQNAPNLPNPFYPIDRIVDSFVDLHGELVKGGKIQDKPFALMAHGITCWIAMSYAAKHPGKVRKMILVAPTSGNKAWSDGRDRMEKGGQERRDIELEHYAQSLLYDGQTGKYKYQAADGDESMALERKSFTIRFFDFRDLEIGRIFGPIVEKQVGDKGIARVPKYARPMGGAFVPDFSLFKLERNGPPPQTLVCVGEQALQTSLEDGNAIVKHFGGAGRLYAFKRSATAPFIEENEKFVEVVQTFLGNPKPKKPKDSK